MSASYKSSRRDFIAWSMALASGIAGCGRVDENSGGSMTDSLTDLSAVDAIAAMRRGDIRAEAYASALLDRCQAASHLNAFITLQPDQVLEAARNADIKRASGAALGQLHGLPIPVKDSVNTSEYPTTGGTPALRDFVPAEDAPLVAMLKEAGAIVLGKTNIHELSFGWTSNNQAFGPVRNPYDPSRIPGGSSGGTAAAVAAGMAPLGIAEDTQGSIRVPAALCGIYGLRPTQNRYPNEGVIPITPMFDQVGPHARNVADLALFDHVITGELIMDSPTSMTGLRLGVPRAYFYEMLDSEVRRITETALRILADAGAVLVEADVPELSRLIPLTTDPVQSYHAQPMLIDYLKRYKTGITFAELVNNASPDIQAAFASYVLGGPLTANEEQFVAARDVYLPALRDAIAGYFADNDLSAMVFPAAQVAAPPIGDDTQTMLNGEPVQFVPVISRNISPGSTAGIPGLVIPAGLNEDGLPVSLEFDAPAGRDRELLAMGLAIESVLGHLPPPAI